MTIEALRKSLQSPYGIQSLNTHDIVAAIEEFDALKDEISKVKVDAVHEFAKWCQAEADSMADIHGKQAFAHAYKCHAAGLAIEFACKLEKDNERD